MIQSLSGHAKKIASFLFFIFYAELYCSNKVFAAGKYNAYANASKNFYPATRHKTENDFAKVPVSENLNSKPASIPVKTEAAKSFSAEGKSVKQEIKKLYNGGPGQPEMQSFQSVNTNNMVDLFSGDFSYSVPLMDVGGYPVNLHYRSGISMDQDASWVGLGWNVNPGTITRNMRGIPDDFNGETKDPDDAPDMITKTFSVKKNWTAGATVGFSPELFGYDPTSLFNLSLSGSLFYNNYKGIGFSAGLNASISGGQGSKGSLTGGLSIVNNSQSGISITPSFDVMMKSKKDPYSSSGFSVGATISTRGGLQALTIGVKGERKDKDDEKNIRRGSFDFSPISFLHQAYTPTIQIPFTNFYTSLSVKGGGELFGFSGMGSIGGYYSEQFIAKSDRVRKSPAFGYLYLQANKDGADALLDFNREKELTYRESPATPHLAIPIYTHDIYSITGEGTGGMFRPYRSDIGYVTDQTVKSKNTSVSVGLELGGGELIHAGGNIEPSLATTASNIWTGSNELKTVIPYKQSDGTMEAVYFRNPSEKTINTQDFYDNIGDTDPMLPLLDNNDDPVLTRKMQPYKKLQVDGAPKTFTADTYKHNRDKRTQVISYLNAETAAGYALDKTNLIYPENAVYASNCVMPPLLRTINTEPRVKDYRKKHHLSEISVLNNDGRRYMYGLPVYNTKQLDVNFSVDKSKADVATGLVTYDPGPAGQIGEAGQNSPEINVPLTDNYYSKEEMPAYAHSFMLTGILSADYVDRLGDGITDDDQGDAVKFNYSRIFGSNNSNFFKWRTPFAANSANYNEGLKTDVRDDKGSYIYGEKEIVYLNSIESKTMIAVFTLNDPISDTRKDGYQVIDENGGLNTDKSKTLRFLKQIDLYAKADLLKNNTTAKPIKTVHFEYGYDLCHNNPSSANGEGKLTLKKVWFSYYGNQRGKLNPYVFYYHPVDINDKNNNGPNHQFNPDFHAKKYDRWGNYKDFTANPSNLDNADYPYATQDAAKANDNASAWMLTDVQLPSGGRLNVAYESDDYAYVQNKRAAQMTQIIGFGNSSSLSNANRLYQNTLTDNHFVFIKVPEQVASKDEVYQKYLEGIQKLYFRLRVKMPGDIYGNGYEQITTYGRIEDYGVVIDANGNIADPTIIWVKLQGTGKQRPNLEFESPLAATALQMLRLNLPSKAYPASDVGPDVNAEAVIRSVVGFVFNFTDLFTDFATRSRAGEWAKEADLTSCFVRLNNPGYKKYGGGLRVKSVMVYDNWMKMTGQKEATYGQEYDYTTTKTINGVSRTISSGVAAYEPTIGNEENPFRQPIEYDEQIAPLAPVNNMYSEEPLGEAYFPSASVGYSKVRTHSIHAANIKSATGFEESEFYTTYDFPTVVDKTVLDERKYKPSFLGSLLKIDAKRYLTQAQGFSVETSDMDGKMKASASYPENDPGNAIAYTKYYYQTDDDKPEQKHLNNTVSVVNGPGGTVNTAAQVGKAVEMVVDFREQKSVTQGFDLQVNGDNFLLGVFPFATVIPYGYPQYEENRYRSVATLKLVQRYGILNKIEHYEKGSKVTTENLLYDSETGEVTLSKVQNEFNDPVYTFNYPAHWAYSGMGLAYQNIGATFSDPSLQLTDGKLTISNNKYGAIENYFESGDEIMLTNVNQLKRNDLTPNCDGEFNICANFTPITVIHPKAWAVRPEKIQERHGIDDLRFIDENGKFISTYPGITMTIIRSGKRNMTGASVGSITSLASPLQYDAQHNINKLVFDESTKIVNAAATSYKDFWKVEDARYKPAAYNTSSSAIEHIVLHPTRSFSISHEANGSGVWDGPQTGIHRDNGSNDFLALAQTPYFEMAQRYGTGNSTTIELHSWMNFDLNAAGIPSNAKIVNASLKLYPHFGQHTERTAGSQSEKNHSAGYDPPANSPHFTWGGAPPDDPVAKDNQAYLYFDDNPDLQNTTKQNGGNMMSIFNPDLLVDYDPNLTKSLIKTNHNNNGNCLNCATVRASWTQSTAVVDLTDKVTTELSSYANGSRSNGSWIRMVNSNTNQNKNRLCFWSKNSADNLGDGCAIYDNGPAGQLTLDPAGECTSCSIVDVGHSHFTCNTAPELSIDYLPLCDNGQEPDKICGNYYCQVAVDPPCTSYILDTSVNPYRFGILGNWRMNRAYSYFDTRKETNPANPTNIRDNGVINSFAAYWNWTSQDGVPLQPTTDTVKWVWNSEMTRFNRKGFEIENHDPLGRYNAVQYGYNQTLPVAVSQNARYTDQAFEGFEDADYDNNGCGQPCTIPRHFNIIDNLATRRTTDQAHTGKYSLQLNSGESITASIPLNPNGLDDTLFYKIDTTELGVKVVTPKGSGLKGDYYKLSPQDYYMDKRPSGTGTATGTGAPDNPYSTINNQFYFDNTGLPVLQGSSENIFARWQGVVQITQTGDYTFFSQNDDNAFRLYVTIDGREQLIVNDWPNNPQYADGASGTVYLKKGTLYPVRAEFNNGWGPYGLHLKLKNPDNTNTVLNGPPYGTFKGFYPQGYTTADTAGSVTFQSLGLCISPEGVRAKKQIVYNGLMPSANNKYVVGAWVREQAITSPGTGYSHVQIQANFLDKNGNGIANSSVDCRPTGTVIEGWQRIEEYITIPKDAASMSLVFMSQGASGAASSAVYFDDVRIHPFNANMKSFVYNPVDIKLMAELDENNYASFYEYDDEGTLIRVKKETERGIKTIKETRSALVKDNP